MYWLNPDFVWNGDRLAFVKEYRKNKSSLSAIQNPRYVRVAALETIARRSGWLIGFRLCITRKIACRGFGLVDKAGALPTAKGMDMWTMATPTVGVFRTVYG